MSIRSDVLSGREPPPSDDQRPDGVDLCLLRLLRFSKRRQRRMRSSSRPGYSYRHLKDSANVLP